MSDKKISATSIPLIKLLPNFFTLLSLAIGFNSIRLASNGNWEISVISVLVAGLIDGMDGRIARWLNAVSTFGAELDSLCDMVNFGVAPPLVIYFWLKISSLSLWFSLSMYVICMSIRLARFNISIFDSESKIKSTKGFSMGVPAPAGALLILLPVIIDFQSAEFLEISIKQYHNAVSAYIAFVALLVASRFPTFITKNFVVNQEYIWILLLVGAVIVVTLLMYTWYFLSVLGLLYLFSIPISVSIARKRQDVI